MITISDKKKGLKNLYLIQKEKNRRLGIDKDRFGVRLNFLIKVIVNKLLFPITHLNYNFRKKQFNEKTIGIGYVEQNIRTEKIDGLGNDLHYCMLLYPLAPQRQIRELLGFAKNRQTFDLLALPYGVWFAILYVFSNKLKYRLLSELKGTEYLLDYFDCEQIKLAKTIVVGLEVDCLNFVLETHLKSITSKPVISTLHGVSLYSHYHGSDIVYCYTPKQKACIKNDLGRIEYYSNAYLDAVNQKIDLKQHSVFLSSITVKSLHFREQELHMVRELVRVGQLKPELFPMLVKFHPLAPKSYQKEMLSLSTSLKKVDGFIEKANYLSCFYSTAIFDVENFGPCWQLYDDSVDYRKELDLPKHRTLSIKQLERIQP